MLMVTHDLLFARQLCPRSVVLDEGRVQNDGPTRELLVDPDLLTRFRFWTGYGVVLDPADG